MHQRNVTIFADGEVDRSPCGSGTCARLAVLATGARLPVGTVLRHDSIVGSTFTGTVLDTIDAHGRPAVIPQVTGTAYRTGEHLFSIDPHDPLGPGVRAAVRFPGVADIAAFGPTAAVRAITTAPGQARPGLAC